MKTNMINKNRLAVNIFFGANGFLFANYIARLPEIQASHALDNGAIGLVLLASALGALIAMPLSGWLITNNGSKRITVIAGLLLCLSIPLIGFVPNGAILGMLFFLFVFATGTLDIAMNAQAVMVEKAIKKPIMTSFHALFSAGMMVGAGSSALFTRFEISLIYHLITVSVFSLAWVIWGILHLINDEGQKLARKGKAFRLPEASLLVIGLIAFCCMLGEGAMANWSTNYMLNIADAGPSFAPMGLLAFSSAMMIARFGGDFVRNRLGDQKLLSLNSIIAAIGLGLVLLIPIPWVVFLGLLLVGLGLSAIVPIAYSTAGNAPGLSPGEGISMVATIGYAGFLLGPPIIGFLADWQSLRFALLFTLLLFVLMTMLSFRLKYRNA